METNKGYIIKEGVAAFPLPENKCGINLKAEIFDAVTKNELFTFKKDHFHCSCCAIPSNGHLLSSALRKNKENHTDYLDIAFSPEGHLRFVNHGYRNFLVRSPRGFLSGSTRILQKDGWNISHHYFGATMNSEEKKVLWERTLQDIEQFSAIDMNQKIILRADDLVEQELRKITDDMPFILPPDTSLIGYDFLPVMIQRGCKNTCKECKFHTPYKVFSEKEIDAQLAFFQKNYPRSLEYYHGALLGGEDVLSLDTQDIVKTLEKISCIVNFSREDVRDFLLPVDFSQGFAYMFGSFASLKKKSVDELRALKSAGVKCINVGVESFNSNLLKERFNKQNLGDILDGICKLEESGIGYSLNLIYGLPNDEYLFAQNLETLLVLGITPNIYFSKIQSEGSSVGPNEQEIELIHGFKDVYKGKSGVYPEVYY